MVISLYKGSKNCKSDEKYFSSNLKLQDNYKEILPSLK